MKSEELSKKGLSTALIAVIVVVVVAVGGIGIYYLSLPKSPTPATVTVDMPPGVGSNQALNFQPATITVVIGVNNTIKWVNSDTVAHTVMSTSGPAEFGNDGTIAAGATFTWTMTTAGTYQYECSLHPTNMHGTVIVKSA